MSYTVEGLEHGIEQCEKNIRTFKDAIKKELDTIVEYKILIEGIKKKEAIPKKIVIDAGGGNGYKC